jgi:hypothetical protein
MKAERSRRPAGSLRAIGSAGLLGLLICAGASVPWTAYQPAAQAVMQPPSTPAIPEIASLFSDANVARANATAAAAILGLTQHQVGLVFSALSQEEPVAAGDMITLSGPCGNAVLDVSMTEDVTPPGALPAGVEDIKLVSGILRTAQGQVYAVLSSAKVASCSNGDPRLVFGFIGHSADGPTMSAAQQNYMNAAQARALADAGGPQPTPTPAPNPGPAGGGSPATPPPQYTPAQYRQVRQDCLDARQTSFRLCIEALRDERSIGQSAVVFGVIATTALVALTHLCPAAAPYSGGGAVATGSATAIGGGAVLSAQLRMEQAQSRLKASAACCEAETSYLEQNNMDPHQWRIYQMSASCTFMCP